MVAIDNAELRIEQHPDDVDAHRVAATRRLLPVHLGELPELALFAQIHRLLWQTEAQAATGLDLDDHQRLPVLSDQVDLTQAATPVDGEHAHPRPLQVLAGRRLARGPDAFPQ